MPQYSAPAITEVTLHDHYLAPRIEINHSSTLPMAVRRCKETGRIDSFRLKWKKGQPNPPHIFWDSDVGKVLEGLALDLLIHPDRKQEAKLEELVQLVISARQPDGYLNSYYTQVEPQNRWSNLHDNHELYCAGHLIEAAVAHYQATGRHEFLDVMCRYADLIEHTFGPGPDQKHGYPGHEELELALCRLADITGEQKYLRLAKYMIDQRGQNPNYFLQEGLPEWQLQNRQADRPVREQTEAEGHAVRAVYLYCGMADTAAATDDPELLEACERMFDSIAERKMYVTGGIGSTGIGESFEGDYKLPNVSAYAESCAAIGLALFAKRMLNLTGKAKYAEVLERVLYNGLLSGISLDGDKFFYQNMLEVNAHSPFAKTRQKWFDCSCCPTNFSRFLPQMGTLLWSGNTEEVRLHIPAASEYRAGGRRIRVDGDYPYDGRFQITMLSEGEYAFSFRVPAWCRRWTVRLNGRETVIHPATPGYQTIRRVWQGGDTLSVELDMPVQPVRANPKVYEDAGKIALTRGPLVYALESIENGTDLAELVLNPDQDYRLIKAKGLPAGTIAITGKAYRETGAEEDLYQPAERALKLKACRFTAIPYSLWQNRGESEMQVWLRAGNDTGKCQLQGRAARRRKAR